MSKVARSLLALTLSCAFAAALFGFGTNVSSFRPSYASWATLDIIAVGIASTLAQGLRLIVRND